MATRMGFKAANKNAESRAIIKGVIDLPPWSIEIDLCICESFLIYI